MGLTRFDGPVYGAKSLLMSGYLQTLSSASTITIASVTIPTYQSWLVTELHAFRGSTGSTSFVATLLDDSTSVATVALGSSVANASSRTTIAATPGEYEGYLAAAGSVISLTAAGSSAQSDSSQVSVHVYGYIRYVDSTRSYS